MVVTHHGLLVRRKSTSSTSTKVAVTAFETRARNPGDGFLSCRTKQRRKLLVLGVGILTSYYYGLRPFRSRNMFLKPRLFQHYLPPKKSRPRRTDEVMIERCAKTTSAICDVDFPQKLQFGPWIKPYSALPYLSGDVWAEIVDNKHTFFLRNTDEDFPSYEDLATWVCSRQRPVTLVMSNSIDQPFPSKHDKDYEALLIEPKLRALFVVNPTREVLETYSKVKPLPLGPKWQHKTNMLYGENKESFLRTFSRITMSPKDSSRLFVSLARNTTVWVRPMTQRMSQNYDVINAAMKTPRDEVCATLSKHAPESVVCSSTELIPRTEYFSELLKHRFVASPTGNGLDSHATWEALMAGCVPIVPRSALDEMFVDLPVWFVDSWSEVTDDAVRRKSRELMSDWKRYDWTKVFAEGWRAEIYKGYRRW